MADSSMTHLVPFIKFDVYDEVVDIFLGAG